MKKLMTLCLVALLALATLAAGCGGGGDKKDAKADQKAEKVLRIGTNADFAPFEFQDVGGKEYQGFDMDLIRAVGKELGYEVEIQNIGFDGLIPALEAKNIDVIISGVTINEERKAKVLFSDPVIAAIAKGKVEGVTGTIKYDGTGDPVKSTLIIGFKDEVLVYGAAKPENIRVGSDGQPNFMFSEVYIVDKSGECVREYKKNGLLVSEVELTSNDLRLVRVSGTAGKYDPAPEDHLIYKTEEDERRIPLPNPIIKQEEDGGAIVFGSYAYNIEKLFTAVDLSGVAGKQLKIKLRRRCEILRSRQVLFRFMLLDQIANSLIHGVP